MNRFDLQPPVLIGMVHLPPLPGSPGYDNRGIDAILSHARTDAKTLADAGFSAIMIENFGDTPFFPGRVEPVTIAAMTLACHEVANACDLPFGVNVLRNDAEAALGIASVVDASFIRVNVLIGATVTDQGIIEGHAAEVVRLRDRIAPNVAILADVHVKHGKPLMDTDIANTAEETAYRGRADVLIVSGAGTGKPTDPVDIQTVKKAVPDKPVLIGSGANADRIAFLRSSCDGVIVGTSLKRDGKIENPIDPDLAREFVETARS